MLTKHSAYSFLLLLLSPPLQADALTDGTLGSPVHLTDPHFTIGEELGQRVGTNLFHSFEHFNVPTEGSATFTGSLGIQNVLARVTGPTSSNIDGTLRSTIPEANLYLMNPNGILFGPNARLDLSGSFHATTADTIKLGADGEFNARTPTKSLLTVASPSAFGFLSGPPAAIEVQGSFLQVPEGKELSAIGGDLTIRQGTLYAPAGRINLISVASPGEAEISRDALLSFGKLGTITITQTSFEEARRLDSQQVLSNVDASGIGGGKIFIRGGQFISNGGFIFADTYGDLPGQGVDVDIKEFMALSNAARITSDTVGSGQSGNIYLTTGKLSLSGSQNSSLGIVNAGIATNTYASGNAGRITLHTSSIELDGGRLESTAQPGSTGGNAGQIDIETDRISMRNKAYITSFTDGPGQSGQITANVKDEIVIDGLERRSGFSTSSEKNGLGLNGGDIRINARRLLLNNGGFIDTSSFGVGQAGNLVINVKESIVLSGSSNEDGQPSLISSNTYGKQAGGTIDITTDYLEVNNETAIQSAASEESSGKGGFVHIGAKQLVLNNQGLIASGSKGTGDAGNLDITTDYAILDHSNITAQSEHAIGGNIQLSVTNHFYLFNSLITAQAQGEEGNDDAGNLTISHPHLFIMDSHSLLSAQANVGNGGKIDIKADNFLNPIPENVTATSEKGIDGEVTINALAVDLAGSFNFLTTTYFRPLTLSKQACTIGPKQSSFRYIKLESSYPVPTDLQFYAPEFSEISGD